MARNRDRIDPVLDNDRAPELDQAVLDRRPSHDTRPPRPLGVACIGALMLVGGMLGLGIVGLGLFESGGSIESFGPLPLVLGVQFLLVSSACFLGSFFVWEGFKLGWTLAVLVLFLDVALALQGVTYMLVLSPQSIDGAAVIPPLERHSLKLIVSAIAMAYLFSKPVRSYFRLSIGEASVRAGLALLPIAALWLWSSYVFTSAS